MYREIDLRWIRSRHHWIARVFSALNSRQKLYKNAKIQFRVPESHNDRLSRRLRPDANSGRTAAKRGTYA